MNKLTLNKIPKKDNSLELKTLTIEELDEVSLSALGYMESQLNEQIKNMSPNQKVIDEYQEKVSSTTLQLYKLHNLFGG